MNDLQKRYSAAHKMALHKAMHHLGLAKAAHAKGMHRLIKCANAMVEAKKMFKAADGDTLAQHLAAAHGHFSAVSDHLDDMEAHLGKAMSAWGHSTSAEEPSVGGERYAPSLSDLTEGDVPEYDLAAPYGAKVTMAQAREMAKNAATLAQAKVQVEMLTKQVELLSKMPAGAPRVRTFDFPKSPLPMVNGSGEGDDDNAARLGKLIEGVAFDEMPNDGGARAGATMIANMIKNGPKFGKTTFGKPPMWDQNFRGRGGAN